MAGEFYTPMNVSNAEGTIKHEESQGEPFVADRKSQSYEQTSRIHNRSFEDAEISGQVLWGDEFGTKFMSRTIKGLPPEGKLPWIETDPCTKTGIRVHYLCDEIDAVNTHYTSRILREAGISTERMVRAKKLESLEVNKEALDLEDIEFLGHNAISLETDQASVNIPIELLKEIMVSHLERDLEMWRDEKPEDVPHGIKELLTKTSSEIDEVKKHIRETDFYYYERDLPVNERCWDLENVEKNPELSGKILKNGEFKVGDYSFSNKAAFQEYISFIKEAGPSDSEDYERLNEILTQDRLNAGKVETLAVDTQYKEVLSRIFKYLRVAEGYELDENNPDDIRKFYTQIQPKKMGETLGKLHNMGLTHKYPGRLNWLAVGYLIDLDSVSGEMLGDAAITDSAIKKDLYKTADSLYHYEENRKVIMDPNTPEKNTNFHGHVAQIFGREEAIKMTNEAAEAFFGAYIQTRGLDKEYLKKLARMGNSNETKTTG